MSWNPFKKKESIPPVSPVQQPSSISTPRFTPQTYIPSRDAGTFDSPPYSAGSTAAGNDYGSNRGVGNIYSRGGGNVNSDRNELFSGYDANQSGSGRFNTSAVPNPAPGEETEEDVEGIKKQTRFLKQESVASTRNALRLAREAEETARNTLGRLGEQSEKLANTERHLDVAKGHALRADDKTDELKQLNRSIFRPVVTWNKDAKRAAQESRIEALYEEEREARENAMHDIRDTQARVGKATTYGYQDQLNSGRGNETLIEKKNRWEKFGGGGESDEELENELDENLDAIGNAAGRLGILAKAMNQELEAQSGRITRISNKTDSLDSKIVRNTERLKKI